jgi:hypothetical protein
VNVVVAIAIFARLNCFMAFLHYILHPKSEAWPWLFPVHCGRSKDREEIAGSFRTALLTQSLAFSGDFRSGIRTAD